MSWVCPECGQRYEQGGYCSTEGSPLAETDDPLLGTVIERYRLARTIGEGGMGRVYLAVQPTIGSRVAIKVLAEECARDAGLLDRFFAEAKAVNLIRHENIVSVLDLSRLPNGRPFIVMEFIEGQTLAGIVRKHVAPLGGVVSVTGEVLSALSAAHTIGIVHRDLKPDNVLVTVEGHAKVLDFGIAKLAPGLRDVSPRTKTGALLGTPAYMAPEQISGSANVDARTDVYAAGVMLYEAVTGRTPFAGETLFDLMRAHLEQPVPPPRTLRPDLPPAIEDVILTALQKDPAMRFQSAQAMAQALTVAASALPPDQWKPLSSRGGVITPRVSGSGIGPHSTNRSPIGLGHQSTAIAPPPTEARRRRTGMVVGAVAAVTVAIGIALFAVASSSSPKPPAAGSDVASGAGSVTAAAPIDAAAVEEIAVIPPPTPPVTPPSNPKVRSRPAGGSATVVAQGSASGPIIVGGGSAADHGVFIGSNVHTGSNVIVGSNTPVAPPPTGTKTTITKRADYDPKHFDPVTYLPKALALAQQLIPDARLTRFDFSPVFSDGRVDLTMNGDDRSYEFRSAVQSARSADVPRNVPVERPCKVYIELSSSEITATIRTTEDCDDRLVRHPRCHFASVWKQAIANGTPSDLVAKIAWLSDEQWFFDIDFEGKGGGVSSFTDRCP